MVVYQTEGRENMQTGTQQQKIQAAKRAYIFTLSSTRYTVYLDDGNGLDNLWPSDSHLGKKSQELLTLQVYSEANNYSAFHFRDNNPPSTVRQYIKQELHEINPEIVVFNLDGGYPEKV